MALPANVSFGTVTGRFLTATADSPTDPDRDPEGIAASDLTIRFTPNVTPAVVRDASASPPTIFALAEVPASVNPSGDLIGADGQPGIRLVATTGTTIDPSGWTWKVTLSSPTFPALSFSFSLDPGQSIDLATVVQVPASPGATLAAWLQAVADANAAADRAEAAAATAGSGVGVDPSDVGYDVYLLAGQSNMSGRGFAYDATTYDPQSSRIQQYAAAGPLAGTVAQAFEPLAFADYALTIGMGPGLVFARWVQQITPENRRILLVPAAYGGTGFSTGVPLGWDPAATGNLYTQTITLANAAIAAAGPNARLAGILWVQGEQDATMNPTSYAAKLDALIAGFRSQITGASASTPFVVGRMAPGFVGTTTGAPAIEAAHIAAPSRNAYCAVTAGPSGYDDGLHYTAPGQRIIGRSLLDAFLTARTATAVQPLTVPAAVTLSSVTTGSSTALSWTPQGRTASYLIEQSADGGTTWTTLAATLYGNSYTATSTGTSTYRVTGRNATGLGAPATLTVTVTAPPMISDTFTRADSTTSLGGSWGTTNGTWGIRSGTAYAVSSPGNGFATAPYPCGASDGTASIDLVGTAIDTGSAGLMVRHSDANNYFGLRFGGGEVQPYRIVNGNTNGLPSIPAPHSSSGTVTLAVTMSGSTMTVKVNGTTVGTIEDTFNQTATNHGVWAPGIEANCSLDNFLFQS